MSSNKPLPTDPSKLKTVSNGRLLGEYDPRQPQTPVAQELKSRWGSKPVVAFNQDGSVAVAESNAYMDELNLGEDPMDMIYVQGQLSKVYPIGEAPTTMRPEDPLTPGKTLRGQTELSVTYNVPFQGISQDARQFVRVMLDMQGQPGVPNLKSPFELEQVMNLARGGLTALQQKFPFINVRYGELARVGRLPTLLIEKGGSPQGAAPFASPATSVAPATPVAVVGPTYSRYELDELLSAFMEAFADYEWPEVCRNGLDVGFTEVTSSNVPLRPQVRQLIEYAVREEKLIALVAAARKKNPSNTRLERIAKDLGVPDLAPERPRNWSGLAQGVLAEQLAKQYTKESLAARFSQQFAPTRLDHVADGSNFRALCDNLVAWAVRGGTSKVEILASWVTWG